MADEFGTPGSSSTHSDPRTNIVVSPAATASPWVVHLDFAAHRQLFNFPYTLETVDDFVRFLLPLLDPESEQDCILTQWPSRDAAISHWQANTLDVRAIDDEAVVLAPRRKEVGGPAKLEREKDVGHPPAALERFVMQSVQEALTRFLPDGADCSGSSDSPVSAMSLDEDPSPSADHCNDRNLCKTREFPSYLRAWEYRFSLKARDLNGERSNGSLATVSVCEDDGANDSPSKSKRRKLSAPRATTATATSTSSGEDEEHGEDHVNRLVDGEHGSRTSRCSWSKTETNPLVREANWKTADCLTTMVDDAWQAFKQFLLVQEHRDQRWAAYVDSRTATLLQRLTQWIFIGEEDTFSDWHVDPQGTGAWLYLIAGEKEWEIECAGGDEPSSRPLIKGATKTEFVPRESGSFRHSASTAQRSRTSTKAQRPASCAGASFIEESRAIPTSSQPASQTENVDNRCFVYRFRQQAHQMLYLPAGHWHRARNVTRTAAISHNFLEDEEEFLAQLQQAVNDDVTSGEEDQEKEREPLLLGALQGLRSEIRNALLETSRKMN
ncbi:unnamed protein product [Amoebophrya sp. A120]|nr:unnamed protein product [Amoebophrya sp. A120]|eukprot:GSA120T00015253001.1